MKRASAAIVAESLKRAVIYIRVSTKQQAVRDGNPGATPCQLNEKPAIERLNLWVQKSSVNT